MYESFFPHKTELVEMDALWFPDAAESQGQSSQANPEQANKATQIKSQSKLALSNKQKGTNIKTSGNLTFPVASQTEYQCVPSKLQSKVYIYIGR